MCARIIAATSFSVVAEGQKKVLKMAKEREKNQKNNYQSKLIKYEEERERVLVGDLNILKRWREYYVLPEADE